METGCNTWLVGRSSGEAFVRLWRSYRKHRKHLQYMACEFTCRSFVDFLHEKGIDVHIGLELNNIKLAFYRGMEGESSNISKVIAHFMESGLDMLIGTAFRTSASSESIDRAVDPDVWLRDVFFHSWCLQMVALQVDDYDDKKDAIARDLREARQLLADNSDYDFKLLCSDIENVATLIGLAPDGVDMCTTNIMQAMQVATTSSRLSRLADRWKSAIGAQILQAAKSVLDRKAGDDIAVKKCRKRVGSCKTTPCSGWRCAAPRWGPMMKQAMPGCL